MDQLGKISLGAALCAGLILIALPLGAYLGSRRCRRVRPEDPRYETCAQRYPKLVKVTQ